MPILIMGVSSLKTEYVSKRKRVLEHVRRHKLKYITGGFCLMFASMVGVVLTINRKVDDTYDTLNTLKSVRSKLTTVSNAGVVLESSNIINHIGRNGHPGNVIYCNETKQVFKSHREATRELGIDSRDLWAYLKGIKSDARGYTFTRVGEAQKS